MRDEKLVITGQTIIGEILARHPRSEAVFKKYFSGECFGCPSVNLETLEMAAGMHGYKVDEIIAELEKVIESR